MYWVVWEEELFHPLQMPRYIGQGPSQTSEFMALACDIFSQLLKGSYTEFHVKTTA